MSVKDLMFRDMQEYNRERDERDNERADRKHRENPPAGPKSAKDVAMRLATQLVPGLEGYRPPTTEPAERCKIHDEPLDEKGFCPRGRIDKDAVQAAIITAPPAESVEDEIAELREVWWKMEPKHECDAHDQCSTCAIEFAQWYATKQIERQTPAIIERFVEEVEREVENDWLKQWSKAMQTVKARRSGGEK